MTTKIEATYRRRLIYPYWDAWPTTWLDRASGRGIAVFALEGRVGLFNLGWLAVNTQAPPPLQGYLQTSLLWVIQNAGIRKLGRQTLEELAAMWTLKEFVEILNKHPHTAADPMLRLLLANANSKLE